MERMEKEGVVSQANHAGKRDVLAPPPPRGRAFLPDRLSLTRVYPRRKAAIAAR
jgi:hypothetical protein